MDKRTFPLSGLALAIATMYLSTKYDIVNLFSTMELLLNKLLRRYGLRQSHIINLVCVR